MLKILYLFLIIQWGQKLTNFPGKKSHLVLALNIVYLQEDKCNTLIFWNVLFA